MTRIQCLTTFLRGRDRFEAGAWRAGAAVAPSAVAAGGWNVGGADRRWRVQ